MDYEHASANPAVAKGGPVPSGGEVLTLETEDDADGWRYGTAQLTPRAAELVEAKEYFAVSPEINWDAATEEGKPLGAKVECVAFTNRPFFVSARLSAIKLGESPMMLESRFDPETGRVLVKLEDGTEVPI